MLPQTGGRTEPTAAGHDLHGLVCRLQEVLGRQHALAQRPLMRRRARRCPKPSGEGTAAHRRPPGQVLHGDGLVEVALEPGERRAEEVAVARPRYRLLDELSLTAITVRRNDHPSGHGVGHTGAEVLTNDVEAQVDARRSTLHGAARDRQVLERLKERQRADHQRETNRRESVVLDEMAITAHRRAEAGR